MRARRTAGFSLLAVVAAAAFPASAAAHARIVRSDPADGAVLASAPRAIRVVFDDAIKPVGVNDVVPNVGGTSVLAGKPRLARGGTVLVLPLPADLPHGDYTVVWQVLSDDGHRVSGVFAFAVGRGRAPPTPVLRPASTTPSTQQVAARWLLFVGLLLAAGAAAFWLLVLRPAARGLAEADRLAVERVELPRFAATVLAGCVLFAVGGLELVRGIGWDTRFGLAVNVGIAAAGFGIVLAGAAVVSARFRAPAAVVAVAPALVPSFSGHALDAGVPWPNVAVDLVHIGAAAVWTGSLVGLAVVVPVVRGVEGGAFARRLVGRVSSAALLSVLLLVASGAVRSIFELRAVSQLVTTGYGRALLVKVALLVVLAAIGWTNRRGLDRLERLRRNVLVELVLIAGVLIAVAFLTQLRPGRDAPRTAGSAVALEIARPPAPAPGAFVLAGRADLFAVGLAVEPDRFTVTVLSPNGGAASGLAVSIDGERGHGCGSGCYTAKAAEPRPRVVRLLVGGHTALFTLPRAVRPADALVRRATRAYLALRSVRYAERLSSGSPRLVRSVWREEAPDRVAYVIDGGAAGVVIGSRRWDRVPGKPWRRSEVSPIPEPSPIWGTDETNAFVTGGNARTLEITWANVSIPAWFSAVFDRRTMLPRTLEMTAAAHFMHHDYLAYDRPLTIRPPVR